MMFERLCPLTMAQFTPLENLHPSRRLYMVRIEQRLEAYTSGTYPSISRRSLDGGQNNGYTQRRNVQRNL